VLILHQFLIVQLSKVDTVLWLGLFLLNLPRGEARMDVRSGRFRRLKATRDWFIFIVDDFEH
jgi:hypothetical protein